MAAFPSPAPEFRKAEGDSAASVGRRSRLGDEVDLGKVKSVGDREDGEGAAVGGAVTDALVDVWVFSHSRSEVFSVSLPSWLRGSDVVERRVVMVTGTGFVFLVILFCFLVNLIVFFIVVVEVAFVVLVAMAPLSVFHVSVVLWKNTIVPIVD